MQCALSEARFELVKPLFPTLPNVGDLLARGPPAAPRDGEGAGTLRGPGKVFPSWGSQNDGLGGLAMPEEWNDCSSFCLLGLDRGQPWRRCPGAQPRDREGRGPGGGPGVGVSSRLR